MRSYSYVIIIWRLSEGQWGLSRLQLRARCLTVTMLASRIQSTSLWTTMRTDHGEFSKNCSRPRLDHRIELQLTGVLNNRLWTKHVGYDQNNLLHFVHSPSNLKFGHTTALTTTHNNKATKRRTIARGGENSTLPTRRAVLGSVRTGAQKKTDVDIWT